MAVIDVSKVSVSKVMRKMYAITLKLKVTDGGSEVINRNFAENHKIGNGVDYTIDKFLIKMQAEIDDYRTEQNIYNAVALDSAIITLEEGLSWQ